MKKLKGFELDVVLDEWAEEQLLYAFERIVIEKVQFPLVLVSELGGPFLRFPGRRFWELFRFVSEVFRRPEAEVHPVNLHDRV